MIAQMRISNREEQVFHISYISLDNIFTLTKQVRKTLVAHTIQEK